MTDDAAGPARPATTGAVSGWAAGAAGRLHLGAHHLRRARLCARAGQQVGLPGRGLERLPDPVPGALLHRHLPAVLQRGAVRRARCRTSDHPVEYPVLIGGAMQLVAWLVHPIANPFVRGREFFDVTVVLLSIFFVLGVLATAYLAGRSRRWTALRRRAGPRGHPGRVHQLGPDRDGPGHAGHGRLGGAPRRAGRGAHRAGRGDQVLPGAVPRPTAAALPGGPGGCARSG